MPTLEQIHEPDAWLAERRTYLGGTDAAAVLGAHPYRGPLAVWAEKVGNPVPRTESEAMAWGKRLEPVVAAAYAESTGRGVRPAAFLRHPELPHLAGNPDGLVGDDGLLEVKTVGAFASKDFGPSHTDLVPDHYRIQCAWYLMLADRAWCDLAALIAGQELRIYRVEREPELERVLVERCDAWWRRHVLGGEMPPADPARDGDVIRSLHPRDAGAEIQADGELEALVSRLLDVRAERGATDAEAERLTAEIQLRMGDASVLATTFGRITWKARKDSAVTDWQALALHLGATPADVDRFTTTKPGTRVFLLPRSR